MKNPVLALRVIRFGVFEFDPQSGDLRKHGLKIKLQPQVSKLLSLLLERPGQICVRADLQQRLWPVSSFGDFERCLNKSVHVLREALGDSATNPRFIETAIGVGYRFIPVSDETRGPALGRRKGQKRNCVAVLPVNWEPANPDLELLSKRIVERLIDNISRFPGTRVLAYRTVQHYRDADLDPRTIGEQLFARAVVAGAIVRCNDELLLHFELIDVDDGAQLWGAQFRGLSSDVLASPEKLADSVSSGLRTILAHSARGRRDVRTKAA
jgi:DNA-binding winged helix-turn-helix (wHTH) protein